MISGIIDFNFCASGRLNASIIFKLGVDSPDILGLFYLSSAMVLAKSSHIVHRNISGVDNKTIIQASENGASHFYSVNEEHLKSIADERPMLLPVMLFNIYDVYMKGKKDAIANIDSAANNHLKKELSIINLNIIDALRRPDIFLCIIWLLFASTIAELK